ncbi:MAG: glycoside hydrolase family 2 protein, partial [Bacteroidetes bacterium]|nr:glycoside hydrolase family 2 protein [Bacteroidota bacterium]
RSVIDELILNDFTKQWKHWAEAQGKLVRNQSHGSPANTLDLYSVVDIPETEGTDILRFKFATSAAHVMGKQLASSESATWLNDHFLSSWGDVKQAIDLYFLGGVNYIFYHGTAYSPKDAPWPGWLFYAAVHFQPNNPQWKDFHVLNEYIAKVQSFLQQGRPDNDVLLYYPIADRYSEPGNALLQHFDGMERNFDNTDFEQVSKWMLQNGYSFDFFSDRQLQNFTVAQNKVLSNGNSYQCILLPANKFIPLASMEKLMELVKKGAIILFYKGLPDDVPGFANLDDNRRIFGLLKSKISLREIAAGIKSMKTGNGGTLAVGNDLDGLFYQFAIRNETMNEKGLQFIRRKNGDDIVYFICNKTSNAFNGWVTLQAPGESVVIYDPMTSKTGLAEVNHKNASATDVRLQLQPGESCILKVAASEIKTDPYPYYKMDSASMVVINGKWKVEFLDGGPKLPASYATDKLNSWTEAGDDAKNFSGTAKYTVTFKKPKGKAGAYLLDLGKVHETAEIFINGERVTSLIGPEFKVILSKEQLKKKNKLEIVVANLMANRIEYMDKNNLPWKIFYNTNMPAKKRENSKNGLFDASQWSPLPSGLMGPVTISILQND